MSSTTNIYVKTHSLEPIKSFPGDIANSPLKKVDSEHFEMYSCDAVLGMQMQLTRRDNPNSFYVDEIEGETVDYSELGFRIEFNPTREIFGISEMYDWQFNVAVAVGIILCRKLNFECLVMREDRLVSKFVPNKEPVYFSTYYKFRHVLTTEELTHINEPNK